VRGRKASALTRGVDTMLDFEYFETRIAGLFELLDPEPTKGKLKMYYEALKDLTEKQLSRAINDIVRERTFAKMPLPGEILAHAQGRVHDKAVMALAAVEKAMREVHGTKSVVFDDPVIHFVIARMKGGWIGICEMPSVEWKKKRDEFVDMYKTFHRAVLFEETTVVPKMLVGSIEAENTATGFIEVLRRDVHLRGQLEQAYVGDRKKIDRWHKMLGAREQKMLKAGRKTALSEGSADVSYPDGEPLSFAIDVDEGPVIDIEAEVGDLCKA
jgi:hypothetical protein